MLLLSVTRAFTNRTEDSEGLLCNTEKDMMQLHDRTQVLVLLKYSFKMSWLD